MNNDQQLFQKAFSRVTDPSQRGLLITGAIDGKCCLTMPDPSSGILSRYDLDAVSATIQIQEGVCLTAESDELVQQRLCIFIFNADFGSEDENRLLPKTPGTFEVYTLQGESSVPSLIAASVSEDCQLDLTAIGTGDYTTKGLIGLRAVFPSNHARFGVVAITASQEIISLWYKEKLEAIKPCALPTDEDEYHPLSLLNEHQWRKCV